MCAWLLAFFNGDLRALFDRSNRFYHRQLALTTKEKSTGCVDDPDVSKNENQGGRHSAMDLPRIATAGPNNFKFTESQRIKDNREAVKWDNSNIFNLLDSDGYVRLKADVSASSKELYEAYQIYCTENNLLAL